MEVGVVVGVEISGVELTVVVGVSTTWVEVGEGVISEVEVVISMLDSVVVYSGIISGVEEAVSSACTGRNNRKPQIISPPRNIFFINI